MSAPLRVEVLTAAAELPAAQWNRLTGTAYPFLRHEFMQALEASGAVSVLSGWEPGHLLLTREGAAVGLLPLYRKRHSQGEYVFDHDWAYSYQHYGERYYPKWLTAVPFTPCAGPRLALATGEDPAAAWATLLAWIQARAGATGISSWHCLFPTRAEAECLQAAGLGLREGVQFQWFNRGYRDFDDFLDGFSAKRRKALRRERRRVAERGIVLRRIAGTAVSEAQWRTFHEFYRMTYLKRGQDPYLNLEFFLELANGMPEQLLLVVAERGGRTVGAALSLRGADTLYGRYWGCAEEYHSLHFEACYYQGLEYCIAEGLSRFDSGAQGEHKISRGFEPVSTWSAHWIRDPRFAAAIGDFLLREQHGIARYKAAAGQLLPFRKG